MPVMPAPACRVLIADDYPDVAESLSAVFALAGCDTRAVGDGAAVLPAVRAFRPHVLLLDLHMPAVTGAEVARQIRELPAGDRPRVVVVSALNDPVLICAVAGLGIDGYFVKPADPAKLVALVRRLCGSDGGGGRLMIMDPPTRARDGGVGGGRGG
jgi:DNA-binding response OmpR family regulator